MTLDSAVEHLLSHDRVEGVPEHILHAFRMSYASTAYRCRYPHCPKASAGFASEHSRSQHEASHFRRLYCEHESCSYSRIGFDKHSALASHRQRYHAAKASLMIPRRIREQDDMSEPHQQGQVESPSQMPNTQSFLRTPAPITPTPITPTPITPEPVAAMFPSGSGAGPSLNPADTRSETPKPSYFPDPDLAPPGMPPQFYPRLPNNPMMRPPSSHTGTTFNDQQQLTPQKMEAMRIAQMNGQWSGGAQQTAHAPSGDTRDNGLDTGLDFGDGDVALENFDFDSFLHTGEDDGFPSNFRTP